VIKTHRNKYNKQYKATRN